MSNDNKSSTKNHASSSLIEKDGLLYMTGFGNTFESQVLDGALPRGRNNPRRVPFNLYAEQLSGTAFTSPRSENRRTWLYRMQPSVVVEDYNNNEEEPQFFGNSKRQDLHVNPNPMRWMPMQDGREKDFISGMQLMLHKADQVSIYVYSFDTSMNQTHLCNAEGDFLMVPQQGSLSIYTELGRMIVHPKEICVIPRGVVFSVHKIDDATFCRGYMLEVHQGHFQLPELGPIGSNGLANARDFFHPTAWCITNRDEYRRPCIVLQKFGSGRLFPKRSSHSPFNVVAWHGNYVPFVYNLERFCAVNSVTFDHLDPSIYTVLTCPSAGTAALADFVVFPPRVMATDENTLRPPWFHRNVMTEFMGLIVGTYDAKSGEGFVPGGASLHPCMTPHGPDAISYRMAVRDACETPAKLEGGLAFMFETSAVLELSSFALRGRDAEYSLNCWQTGLEEQFTAWDLLEKHDNNIDGK